MSTYQLLNCAIRNAICRETRTMIVSVRQALFSFAMPFCFFAAVFLSVTLPVQGTPVHTGLEGLTDTLNKSNEVSVFTETLLFPKASSAVLRDFAENGTAIDSICRFFSVNDTRDIVGIKVIGSYSPEGEYAFNINLAETRARALGSLVRKIEHAVDPEISISHPVVGQTDDYRSLRSAELQIVYHNAVSARNMLLHLDTVHREGSAGATGGCDYVLAGTCGSDMTILPPPTKQH